MVVIRLSLFLLRHTLSSLLYQSMLIKTRQIKIQTAAESVGWANVDDGAAVAAAGLL